MKKGSTVSKNILFYAAFLMVLVCAMSDVIASVGVNVIAALR